jgi:hypothetical protein
MTCFTPNIAAIIIVVVVVVLVARPVMVLSRHKLLLNPETLKVSTDTPIGAVRCWGHVEILVDLVEILVDLVVDGVKWTKIYTVPIHYGANLTREVAVLNPRVERNSVLRENNTVFFPRDAPS